jgi:TatD DNase family protein
MILADTHAHLYVEQFDQDRDAVMQRALQVGVAHFFIPAIDASYTQSMLDLEAAYPEHVHLMMGLHPTHVGENYSEELEHVRKWLDKRAFCAVGEIGIDLYWDKSFLTAQQRAFDTQIQWAKERLLPVVIHSRDSFDEIIEVLNGHRDGQMTGIFHCFTGTFEQAQQVIDFGMKLGIGGVVTFKNGKIDRFLREIPLEHLVLETDSHWLAPTPYRGKRNESSYLINVVNRLAESYERPADEIAAITTKTALDVFRI